MEIEQRIEEVQSKLIKTLTETNFKSTEETMKQLDRFGIDVEAAAKLIEAYQNAESAKNAANNVWDDALNCRQGDDLTTHIAKSQQQEADTRQYFDTLTSKCALLIVVERLDPSKINSEILDKLYGEGIREEQIYNPALRITYHYYRERKEIENDRNVISEKFGEFASKAKVHIEGQRAEIEELKKRNRRLEDAYRIICYESSTKAKEDEKHYQDALLLIRKQKEQITELENRGIFRVIFDKVRGKNATRRLPGENAKLPETLSESRTKTGMPKNDNDTLNVTRPNTQTSSNNQAKKEDEIQK